MKKKLRQLAQMSFALFLSITFIALPAHAAETTDDAVQRVIAQLESIDTLQQMQNKRKSYTASGGHYDINTTNTATIAAHEAARTAYETYVSEMFAARIAARNAYDALTPAQKAQIDSSLVAKLSDSLPTVFHSGTFPVTPSDNAYTFETVRGGAGYGYEIGNHMVSGEIPQTFILVDTSSGETSWTPSGRYVFGESNYEVTYCCDVETGLAYNTHYKRINLEDSDYYGPIASQHIRAILQYAYPYVTIEEMKDRMKDNGMDEEFVDSLTRADIISAVQMAVWTYANAGDGAADGLSYFATIDVPKNTGIYFTPLHDYTNELWDWLPGKRQRSFDIRAEYRVNALAYYLCMLPGVEANENQIVISDVQITRADLVSGSGNTYQVGMYVYLNHGGTEADHLKVTATSYRPGEDGSPHVTDRTALLAEGNRELQMSIRANSGDTIRVEVEGTQYLSRGVYFYEPEGGRKASQSLVGVSEGKTSVYAEEEFLFEEEPGDMGLRIYKTEKDTGAPLSDIVFHVYEVDPAEGGVLSETPTEEEVAIYGTEENLVVSLTTDTTGYASTTLDEGLYLVVEEHNEEKIKAPVPPFYIMVPMQAETESEDGTVTWTTLPIVSVYPKNETVPPPEEPPIIPPPPSNVFGTFEILKYDATDPSILLEGAKFQVYRAATAYDLEEEIEIILSNGTEYAAVPALAQGEPIILTTDENGYAASPEVNCGIYFLVELEAPAGYNASADCPSVTVIPSVMNTVPTVEIPNERGNILPSTGGPGTIGYTSAGILLILAAGSLLLLKKSKAVH